MYWSPRLLPTFDIFSRPLVRWEKASIPAIRIREEKSFGNAGGELLPAPDFRDGSFRGLLFYLA